MGHSAPLLTLSKLPPAREKVETIQTLRASNKAATALAELKGIAMTIPNQAVLINAIVLQEARDSSGIENIITTQDELYKALAVNKMNISPQVKEVINYRQAIMHGYSLVNEQGFLRVNDIISIQQDLVDNTAGIRSTSGTVLKNDKTGDVVYTPPQDKQEILGLLSNFIDHLNQGDPDLSPLIRMAILHYQFESIHPFYDGNGRTGRILNILYLIMNQLLEIPILYMSSFIIRNKAEYYKLLNNTNRTGDWENWIIYMLNAVEITSLETIEKVKKIRQLLEFVLGQVRKEAPGIYSKELVELLFEQPYSKIDFVVKRLNVERKAASRYLRQLENMGLLESVKVGREVIYINSELIALLRQ